MAAASSPSTTQAAPERGIEPIGPEERVFGAVDVMVLWGSLGVGLLVMEAGTFLVDLGLRYAVLAILLGSMVGVLLLAAAGRIGAVEGVPTMVLLRPVLGLRGSYLPSVLNVLQLVGWTAFELWIMSRAAAVIAAQVVGPDGLLAAPWLWILLFGLWSTLLALGGPLAVVRQWLEKFGLWVMLAASLFLTYRLLLTVDIRALADVPGNPAGFWLMVDLVIAMPISWLPLVADYNRFTRTPRAAFRGTFVGYFVANVWFFLLGLLFVLGARLESGASAVDLVAAVAALTGGALALVAILVDETDNVFADIYSAAVSARNVSPRLDQRWLVVAAGAIGTLLGALVEMTSYFSFLLLIGSVFTPLFGLLLADAYLVRRRDGAAATGGPPYRQGIHWPAVGAWIVGILVYHAAIAADLPAGASAPSFLVAGGCYVLLARLGLVPSGDRATAHG